MKGRHFSFKYFAIFREQIPFKFISRIAQSKSIDSAALSPASKEYAFPATIAPNPITVCSHKSETKGSSSMINTRLLLSRSLGADGDKGPQILHSHRFRMCRLRIAGARQPTLFLCPSAEAASNTNASEAVSPELNVLPSNAL